MAITGAGRGFCAGLDLKEPPTHRPGTPNISPQSRMHLQLERDGYVTRPAEAPVGKVRILQSIIHSLRDGDDGA